MIHSILSTIDTLKYLCVCYVPGTQRGTVTPVVSRRSCPLEYASLRGHYLINCNDGAPVQTVQRESCVHVGQAYLMGLWERCLKGEYKFPRFRWGEGEVSHVTNWKVARLRVVT